MKLTIIPSDKVVIIDGVFKKFDFTIDSNFHAVQWDGSNGFVETIVGNNIELENLDDFSEIVEQHAALVISDNAAAATAQAEYDAGALARSAKAALVNADETMTRVVEAVSLGLTTWTNADVVAFVTYRRALRVIVGGGNGPLPDHPAFPEGT